MDEAQLQAFFSNIEQLSHQYRQLKEHAFHLAQLNEELLQENKTLRAEHDQAKATMQRVLEELKGE